MLDAQIIHVGNFNDNFAKCSRPEQNVLFRTWNSWPRNRKPKPESPKYSKRYKCLLSLSPGILHVACNFWGFTLLFKGGGCTSTPAAVVMSVGWWPPRWSIFPAVCSQVRVSCNGGSKSLGFLIKTYQIWILDSWVPHLRKPSPIIHGLELCLVHYRKFVLQGNSHCGSPRQIVPNGTAASPRYFHTSQKIACELRNFGSIKPNKSGIRYLEMSLISLSPLLVRVLIKGKQTARNQPEDFKGNMVTPQYLSISQNTCPKIKPTSNCALKPASPLCLHKAYTSQICSKWNL